ncbi:hypothetical protein [Burkholderia gladioli]|uniref:hypothetical protein n=1 Tax=Burkholderia gladioli TaxID=28095 RepID=UPI003D1E1225
MHAKCAAAVEQAAGRKLTKAELDGIENRVRAGMRSVSRQDPAAWRSLSEADRVQAGADWARQQLENEANLDAARKRLQIAKQIETTDRVREAVYADPERAHAKGIFQKTVVNDVKRSYDIAAGIREDYMRGTMDSLDATKTGQNFVARAFDVANPAMERDIIREIYRRADGSTGNDVAKAAAEQIGNTSNAMRERFNRAGGNVGQLDYGYVPIRHSMVKVIGNGSDAARHAWADFVLPRLDRSQYLDDAGNPLSDVELRRVLTGEDREAWERMDIAARGRDVPERRQGVWDTISYGGAPKIVPGETKGAAARANAGSQHRVLHFKDADAHIEYNRAYGEGSLLNALIDHVGGMAKNIALVERYGPNPTRNVTTLMQLAAKHDNVELPQAEKRIGDYWNYVTGAANTPVSIKMARFFDNTRATVSAMKLQSTLKAAVGGDIGTLFVSAGVNKVPFFRTLGTAVKYASSSDMRDWAASQGFMSEAIEHGLTRWGGDYVASGWARYLSAQTMKFGGVTAWTNALRNAFRLEMSRGLGKLASLKWQDLNEWDRGRLETAGFNEADWAVVNRAPLEYYRGGKFLTADSIHATGDARAPDLAARLLAYTKDEGEFAVLNPDLRTKVITNFQPGELKGELMKSFMQFKSFPIAMISRHWGRLGELARDYGWRGQRLPEGAPLLANPLAYGGALLATTTLLSAISLQVFSNILAGKDPEPMFDDPKHAASFWTRAFTLGGGMGFLGDVLMSALQSRDYGSAVGAIVGGPLFNTLLFQPLHILSSNATDAANGKDTHAGIDLAKMAQANLPLVNLWYFKTVMNRIVWDNLAENLSPGVTARNVQKSRTQYHNDYYWPPGQSSPDRAPNLATAVGSN